jgi:hypothetical protein
MKHRIIQALVLLYGLLIRLYPRRFRDEFGEEMTAVFQHTLTTAANNWHILTISLRELRDWPISCWREHQRSLGMVTTIIWINGHKRIWRTAVLVLLFISITGPWTFDLIHVPAEYACSLPNYRLEGDFCGIPFSALGIFPLSIGHFLQVVSQLITGTTVLSAVPLELLISSSYLLLFLPFLTTMLMIFRGSHQSKFVVVIWGLAVGMALFFGVSFLIRPHPELWHIWLFRGVWFYIGISTMALLLELTMLTADNQAVP